jgi:hypothetical protein
MFTYQKCSVGLIFKKIWEESSVLDSEVVGSGLKTKLAAKVYSAKHQLKCSYFVRFEYSKTWIIVARRSFATTVVVD